MDALPLKKKKKAKKIDEDDAEAAEAADAMDEAGVDTPAADGDEPVLDLGLKKKKKKVKKAADGEEDSFAAKLQALDLDKEGGEETGAKEDQTGDMNEGTGVWEHNETKPIVYSLLLGRVSHDLGRGSRCCAVMEISQPLTVTCSSSPSSRKRTPTMLLAALAPTRFRHRSVCVKATKRPSSSISQSRHFSCAIHIV